LSDEAESIEVCPKSAPADRWGLFDAHHKLNGSTTLKNSAYKKSSSGHLPEAALTDVFPRQGHSLSFSLVSVQLRTPESKPDLMGTAQALNKIIKKQTNDEFLEIVPLLEELIGDKYKHRTEWNYLNKGTNDEERNSEF
jgi:hypothetical protein